MIDVVWLEDQDGSHGRWTVAGTFNRWLVVFRLLAIFRPREHRNMSVRRVPKDKVKWTLANGKRCLSTKCHGIYVEVRPGRYAGVVRA